MALRPRGAPAPYQVMRPHPPTPPPPRTLRPPAPMPVTPHHGAPGVAAPPPAVSVSGAPGNCRVTGRSGFVPTTTAKPYAEPLLHFLYRKGVEAIGVKSHNGTSYQVIAPEGFRDTEIKSSKAEQYRQSLIDLSKQY